MKKMRKIKRKYRAGESRINSGFLILPETATVVVDGDSYELTRWFEKAKWEEVAYFTQFGTIKWIITRWLDLDE